MAELNQSENGNAKPKKVRAAKLTSRVDLTAMVDLAFLLITFFMLTTSLSEAKSMELVIPEQHGDPMLIDKNRTLTILLDDDNKAKCYRGELADGKPTDLIVGTRELRNEVALRKKEVLAYSTSKGKPDQGIIVLIKPGKKSNYGNLVDVLDEMAISGVTTYAIVDIEPKEAALLEQY